MGPRGFHFIVTLVSMQCLLAEACPGRNSCPEAESIIFAGVEAAVLQDPRMAASLLRLHFHDCFVNGCDGSVLLDDTISFVGEKTAGPNLNSLRGFDVIDDIKAQLELTCPQAVSCADILAVAARDAVSLCGGPTWDVELGRRDSLAASKQAADNNLPGPNSDVATLVTKFQNVGLTAEDVVALSGAHTIGKARCVSFRSRLSNNGNHKSQALEEDFVMSLQRLCSDPNAENATLAQLDVVSPITFDNQYFINLLSNEGLLLSDQALVTQPGTTRDLVQLYAVDQFAFFDGFKRSMVRMGRLQSPPGNVGEIRRNCRTVN